MGQKQVHIDDFLLGIAEATNAMISEKLDKGINLAIELLGKHLGVSASCVYVNEKDEKGKVLTSIKYFWSVRHDKSRTDRNQNVPLEMLGDMFSVLNSGDYYEILYSNSQAALQEHMRADGTKSIILFPIMVEDTFWGAVALVEFEEERRWTDPEKSLLQSLANSIGSAVRRGLLEENLEKLVADRTTALERSKTRFQLAVEGSQDGIWEWNPVTGENYWSPRMYELLGYAPDDLPNIGEEFFDMIHPDEADKARTMFHNHLKHRTPYEMEFRLRTKSGKYRWFRSTGQARWNKKGEAVLMVGSHEDISKRREAEEALKESHRRMNSLVDNLPGISYRCLNKENWPMEFISAACQEITGYASSDFYGRPSKITFGDLIHKDDIEDNWEQVQAALSEKRSYRVIYRIIDKAGKEKWLWEQGGGVYDEQGEVEALEGCIFDITPVVRSQERVNGAIYIAEDNERRRIAGEIHDGLQQTLSVSALNLQYLESEIQQLSEECRTRYSKSRDYLERGIRESRLIAHRLMPKSIHEVGLNKALEELVNEVKSITDISCTYYCNLDKRLSDKIEVGLYRMTQEALNNIIKYAKARNVAVQLTAFEKELQLIVEDDGVGFDKNKLDLYKTGFGLTGMKNRINSLSGNLLIDSRPGHGTSIVAGIPIQE
jgi:PAS domain S-box-containing protein